MISGVFLYVLALVVTASVGFGLLPALTCVRTDLASALRQRAVSASRSRRLLGRGLVVTQIALSVVLLVAAGAISAGLGAGSQGRSGGGSNRGSGALDRTFSQGWESERIQSVLSRLKELLEAQPGVVAVGRIDPAPLSMNSAASSWRLRSWPSTVEEWLMVDAASVDEGYLTAIGLDLKFGRWVTSEDRADSTPIVVVNERLASQLATQAGQAIGSRVSLDGKVLARGRGSHSKQQDQGRSRSSRPMAYFPLTQRFLAAQTVVIRSEGDPAASPLWSAVQPAIWLPR